MTVPLIYSYRSGAVNNWLGLALAGMPTRPLTCPPLDAATFPYARLAEADLVYIALHGSPGARMLYGDANNPALDARRIETVKRGAVVILEGCYGLETFFPQAFLMAGASAVLASRDATWDRRWRLGPAGRAGLAMLRALRAGKTAGDALTAARQFGDTWAVRGDMLAALSPGGEVGDGGRA